MARPLTVPAACSTEETVNIMGKLYVGADDDDDLDGIFAGDEDDEDDEVAGDQIVGLDQILGALAAVKPKKKPKPKAGLTQAQVLALVQQLSGGGQRVVKQSKSRNDVYEQPLPIPPTEFTAGQALDIELRPQRLFRSERLVVDSTIAPYFRILDLKIGQQTQFVASGALPATIFTEVAVGVRLKGDTANLGNTIIVSAQNISNATRVFGGAILGTVVD